MVRAPMGKLLVTNAALADARSLANRRTAPLADSRGSAVLASSPKYESFRDRFFRIRGHHWGASQCGSHGIARKVTARGSACHHDLVEMLRLEAYSRRRVRHDVLKMPSRFLEQLIELRPADGNPRRRRPCRQHA